MKKVFISVCVILSSLVAVSVFAESKIVSSLSYTTLISSGNDNNVVLRSRSTQKLKSRDGHEIYLYTNKVCKMYDEVGNLRVTCTYKLIEGKEILFLDDNGNEVYKGSYRLTSDQQNMASLSVGGIQYYKKND